MVDAIPNQVNFQDPQNFTIDINQVYTDFIQEIDATRSFVNITNPINQSILNVLKEDSIVGLSKLLKIESAPQESRCHAFFRLIGFPVISESKRIYNSGLDLIKDATRTITRSTKIDIANDPLEKFRDLSNERETYVGNLLDIFSIPESLNASVLALQSGVNIRKFVVPLDKSDAAFDIDAIKNQSYTVDLTNVVGKNKISLKEYVDINGNTPDSGVFGPSSHFIKPFVVDARISFSVSPSSRLIAIPFVNDKTQTMVGEGTFVKRPLLEKVIRDRFGVSNQLSTIGDSNTALIDYIKSVPAIQDQSIIDRITSGKDVYGLSDLAQFTKFLNIIRAMMTELVQAQIRINTAQRNYYWLPIPSNIGPENGSKVRPVLASKDVPSNFVTRQDQAIINAAKQDSINKLNALTADISGTSDVGGFVFNSFSGTFNPDTSNALGDLNSETLNTLVSQRNHDLGLANNALRTIEIILGEFSGLGLCDIISIIGALYLMPKEDLLGFLDDDALVRMNSALKTNETKPNIVDTMNSFIAKVKDFYNLMDKIYQDQRHNNGLS